MSRTVSTLLLVLGLVLLGQPMEANAQHTKTLVICDGAVFINGRVISDGELPSSLNLEGVDARFSFSGDVDPVVEINDRMYRLDDGRLQDVGAAANRNGRISVFFRNGDQASESSQAQEVRFFVGQDRSMEHGLPPNYAAVAQHAQAMHEHVAELRTLGFDGERQAAEQLLEQLLVQAQQTASIARELPRLAMENYLLDLQQQNEELYALLMREYTLEREANQLAEEIRSVRSRAERERLTEQLRDRLEEIFEIKQMNRQHEIDRMEAELKQLRTRLEKRERYQDRIIERHLRNLVSNADGNN